MRFKSRLVAAKCKVKITFDGNGNPVITISG